MLTYACKIVILCRKLGNLEKKGDAGNNFHIGYCLFFIFIFWQIFLDNHGEKAGVLCLFSVLLALEQNND